MTPPAWSVLLVAAWLAAPLAAQPEEGSGLEGSEASDGETLALELDAVGREVSRQVEALKARAEAGDTRGVQEAKQALEDLRDRLAVLLPVEETAAPRPRRATDTWAAAALSDLRSSLTLYSAEHGGDYPVRLEVLVPKYLKEIPGVVLPQHPKAAPPRVVNKLDEDDDLEAQLKDSGGWLYVGDPKSPHFGSLLIDCTHQNALGEEWFKQ